MLRAYLSIRKVKSVLSGIVLSAVVGVQPSYAQEMTAGVILDKMSSDERFAYINGMVEGMAYARFRKDSLAAGGRDEKGMACILDWYWKGEGNTPFKIEAAFRQHKEHMPSTIIGTMVKNECGE